MSEHELTTLVFDIFRDMDGQIQFWLEATFAVVVAVFFAGDRLSTPIRRVIAGLYLLASTIAAMRWALFLRRTLKYRERLREGGYPDIETDPALVGVISPLIMLMFIVGVVATLYFISRPASGRAEAP